MRSEEDIKKENDERTIIAERIRILLKKNNTNENRLAVECEIDQSNLNKRLNHKDGLLPTYQDAIKCAKYFNVSVDWILGRTDISEVGGIPFESSDSNTKLQKPQPKDFTIDDLIGLFCYLLKTEIVKPYPIAINEDVVYVYDKNRENEMGTDCFVRHKNMDVTYQSLYFPKFWNPDTQDEPDEATIIAKDNGNEITDMSKLNKMIEDYVHYVQDYKDGILSEKQFDNLLQTDKG